MEKQKNAWKFERAIGKNHIAPPDNKQVKNCSSKF
jgi:hypothetical protein